MQLVSSVRAPVSYVCKSGTRTATSHQYELLFTRHITMPLQEDIYQQKSLSTLSITFFYNRGSLSEYRSSLRFIMSVFR